jgi:hypothetical protein
MGIMGNVLLISELIGTNVRSRSNAGIIQAVIDGVKERVTLDFREVTFVSRSFADELCNIMDDNKNIKLSHMSDLVSAMIHAVSSGRKEKRVRPKDDSEMKEFESMEGLYSFLHSSDIENNSGISIRLGKRTDSFEMLERLCKEEAEKLRAIIKVPDHGKVSVPFWTAYQFSELIGVAYFSKDKNGEVVYELDFSETTL